MPYYVIHEFGDNNHVWNILCTSFEEALGHVVHKVRDMNIEFRKENPQWQSVDPEYYIAKMEDDYSIEEAKEPSGTMVANYLDYKTKFFVKEVHLKRSD